MWKTAILTVVVFAVSLAEGCTYKDRECPDYTVVEKHADYEIRSYPALTWAVTSEQSRIRRVAQYATFMRLFRYISGANDKEQKMNMTVPVPMQVNRNENGTLLYMSFMVPSEFAADPPKPTNEKVKIVKNEPAMYAVRSFSGYILRDSRWEEEAQKMADSLKDDETVDKISYLRVGYDAPFDILDRRNEIWMLKNGNQANNEV